MYIYIYIYIHYTHLIFKYIYISTNHGALAKHHGVNIIFFISVDRAQAGTKLRSWVRYRFS